MQSGILRDCKRFPQTDFKFQDGDQQKTAWKRPDDLNDLRPIHIKIDNYHFQNIFSSWRMIKTLAANQNLSCFIRTWAFLDINAVDSVLLPSSDHC